MALHLRNGGALTIKAHVNDLRWCRVHEPCPNTRESVWLSLYVSNCTYLRRAQPSASKRLWVMTHDPTKSLTPNPNAKTIRNETEHPFQTTCQNLVLSAPVLFTQST